MPKASDPRSFLVINPFGIGDCLFSTPLISLLHRFYPSAKIYFLCNNKTYPVVSSHPLIKKAFVYERDDFVNVKKGSFFKWLAKYSKFLSDIRRERIDVCLDLSMNTQYGFYAWAAGIPRRYGLDYKNRCCFLTKKISIDGFEDKHVADHYLDVARLLDLPVIKYPMSVGISDADKSWAREWIDKNNINSFQVLIGVAPCGGDSFGANAYIKRWPAENYSALIKRLRQTYNTAILLFAGPRESSEVIAIIGDSGETAGIFDLSGATLGQTIALLSHCALFVGNDTGAMRFADALGKKLVSFFGPQDDAVYGPYPYDKARTVVLKKELACRPCYKRFRLPPCSYDRQCLRSITVDEAFEAAKALLGNRA